MLPFHVLCPEVASAEVRTVTLEPNTLPEFKIPPDTYGFLEFYCEEQGCDCRRVLLAVFSESGNREVARISHAFEPPEDEKLRELGQTYLDPYGQQESYAEDLLRLFKKAVLDDTYAAQLERHYKLFKERLESQKNAPETPPPSGGNGGHPRSIGPNQPCPCGSGKKYKKCCGRV